MASAGWAVWLGDDITKDSPPQATMVKKVNVGEILGSHGGEYEDVFCVRPDNGGSKHL
jgi:hypothetical protein